MVSLLTMYGFTSCISNSDTEWRDANIAYLKKISTQPGIKVVGDSLNGYPGIYYEVLKEGNGVRPVRGNVVNVAYKGCLYNDTTAFDSSLDYDVRIGTKVIEGWSLALENMHVGDKWRVYIPYNLGYGSTGTTDIPAYSTLIFEIYLKELVSDN
jgi:FKBP-type peptidyl-prolyl cis-trans isomerase